MVDVWKRIAGASPLYAGGFGFQQVLTFTPGQSLKREIIAHSFLWQAVGTAPNFDQSGPSGAGRNYEWLILTAGNPVAPQPQNPLTVSGQDIIYQRILTWGNDTFYPTGDYTQWRSPVGDQVIDILGRRTATNAQPNWALWYCWIMSPSPVVGVNTFYVIQYSAEILLHAP